MKGRRIPCIVPFCRCTADAAKVAPNTEIICQKHWRLVPAQTKARYRTVKRRATKIWKLINRDKRVFRPGADTAYFRAQDSVGKCWRQIKREAIERAAGI